MFRACCSTLALTLLTATLCADVVHDESVDGDLSGDPAAPTAVTFGPGGNIVTGSVMDPVDRRDYLTFTIPEGGALVALIQLEFIDIDLQADADVGYNALDAGPTSVTPNMANQDLFLGGSHIGTFAPGTDMLPLLANAVANGSGFTIPLGPGTYTYVIQQTGPEHTGYTIEFVVDDSWTDEGCALAGTNGEPLLTAEGFLGAGELSSVVLSNALPNALAGLFIGFSSSPLPFKGGFIKPNPFFGPFLLSTFPNGEVPLAFSLDAGVPPGAELWFQWAIQDPGAVFGVALSNAVRGVTP